MGHLVDILKFITLYCAQYNIGAEEATHQRLQPMRLQETLCIIRDLFTFVKHPKYNFNV